MITNLNFEPEIRCRIAPLSAYSNIEPKPAEMALVENAVPVRRQEFAAGRALTRELLAEAGKPTDALLQDGRQPAWPTGVRGSISHTRTLVGAAISPEHLSPGLDIEVSGSVEAELVPQLLQPEESGAGFDPTTCFSCKEALFKAVYPLVGEYFEFLDVTLDIRGDSFTARSSLPFANVIERGHGRFQFFDNHIVSLFCTSPD